MVALGQGLPLDDGGITAGVPEIADDFAAPPAFRRPRGEQPTLRTGLLLDHLVGAGKQQQRYFDTKRPCGLQIDDQLKLVGLIER